VTVHGCIDNTVCFFLSLFYTHKYSLSPWVFSQSLNDRLNPSLQFFMYLCLFPLPQRDWWLYSWWRQLSTLNLPEHSSVTASFLGRLSSSLQVLVVLHFCKELITYNMPEQMCSANSGRKEFTQVATKLTCTVLVTRFTFVVFVASERSSLFKIFTIQQPGVKCRWKSCFALHFIVVAFFSLFHMDTLKHTESAICVIFILRPVLGNLDGILHFRVPYMNRLIVTEPATFPFF
jgi:hypothetical protein